MPKFIEVIVHYESYNILDCTVSIRIVHSLLGLNLHFEHTIINSDFYIRNVCSASTIINGCIYRPRNKSFVTFEGCSDF